MSCIFGIEKKNNYFLNKRLTDDVKNVIFVIQNNERVTMEKKIVNIRKIPVDTWHKARLAALKEKKTIGQWLTEIIEKHLKREKKE